MNHLSEAPDSGRVCPLDYHYTPAELADSPVIATDTLYVIGGLYGNPFALAEIEQLAASENARCVFNGDFNWFNCNEDAFTSVNNTVLRHDTLRGNVETEIARDPFGGGCGCGYPDNVSDDVVSWSNQIIARLNQVACKTPDIQKQLQALPVTRRYQTGDNITQIVHGDCRSLAGWSLSRENLSAPTKETVADAVACKAQIIACTHTCDPIATTLNTGSLNTGTSHPENITVINNGAAGMPNFDHDLFGVITRIAVTRSPHAPVYGAKSNGVHIDAIPVRYDQTSFLEWFQDLWPAGSAAHNSYFDRIAHGASRKVSESVYNGFQPADTGISHHSA